MSQVPEVTVVMSVFNSARTLGPTLESVLAQEGVTFEVIAIDDGSTDETAAILDQAAANDERLNVVHQENQGLTRSLMRGCAAARGRFLAVQDAGGDRSLPGRLKTLVAHLGSRPDVALVSSGARFVGPKGEFLFDRPASATDLTPHADQQVRGPAAHGATMFRKADYEAVGGYRGEFAVAQDLDLWLRLVERGEHLAVPETLYEVCISPDSISGLWRDRQVLATRIILACAKRRRNGGEESDLLEEAALMPRRAPQVRSRRARSKAIHFIARCLHSRDPVEARGYYLQAIREFPFNLKSWLFLITSLRATR